MVAVAVSELFGLAFNKVVDQFWSRSSEPEMISPPLPKEPEPDTPIEPMESQPPPPRPQMPVKPVTSRKSRKTRAAANKKKAKPAIPSVEMPVLKRSLSITSVDSVESCHSDASTYVSSEDEDDHEADRKQFQNDLGDQEMKLMQQRAQEIKRLAKAATRANKTSKKATAANKSSNATKQKIKWNRIPAKYTPRIANQTNALWNWSVYSGFEVDRFCGCNDFCMEDHLENCAVEHAERFEQLALNVCV